jgi:hypothetical protein
MKADDHLEPVESGSGDMAVAVEEQRLASR